MMINEEFINEKEYPNSKKEGYGSQELGNERGWNWNVSRVAMS